MSIPISRAGAECVSAPIAIRSTPVSAIARTVARFTPPEASNSTRGANSSRILTACLMSSGGMLSRSTALTPQGSTARNCSKLSTSTSTNRGDAAADLAVATSFRIVSGSSRSATCAIWLSFTNTASYSPSR